MLHGECASLKVGITEPSMASETIPSTEEGEADLPPVLGSRSGWGVKKAVLEARGAMLKDGS